MVSLPSLAFLTTALGANEHEIFCKKKKIVVIYIVHIHTKCASVSKQRCGVNDMRVWRRWRIVEARRARVRDGTQNERLESACCKLASAWLTTRAITGAPFFVESL